MLVPVIIDVEDLTSKFAGITKENVDNLCNNVAKGIAAGYARQLEEEAQKALHQTRRRYINSITLVDEGKLEGVVFLSYRDPVVGMIEEGASAFDIKRGLLNSSKVKISKDGRKYITIPFRMATPGAVAESDVFSGTLPDSVYDVLKNKVANKPSSGGGTVSSGLTLGEIPVEFKTVQTRAEIKNDDGNPLWDEYKHKSSIYQGLMKRTDPVTGQNTYGGFRRVSEPALFPVQKHGEIDPYRPTHFQEGGSDPDSWIHPGIEAHNLISVALQNYNVDAETQALLDFEISKLGFEV